jgi:starvation-inducible DNA-binding protein
MKIIPNIGLNEVQREALAEILKTLVSDEFVLSTKTRKHFWNVTGPRFQDIRAILETQFGVLVRMTNDLAERIRTLGKYAPGTMAEFQKLTELTEQPAVYANADSMIVELLSDHETLIRRLRFEFKCCIEAGDCGTADLLAATVRGHEEMAWMLRSLLDENERVARAAAAPPPPVEIAPMPRVAFSRPVC